MKYQRTIGCGCLIRVDDDDALTLLPCRDDCPVADVIIGALCVSGIPVDFAEYPT